MWKVVAVSKRYEREIEEILRRNRAPEPRPGAPRGGPPTWSGSGQRLGGWQARFNRIFQTPAERLVGLAALLGVVTFLLRLLPPSPLPALVALVALAIFWFAILSAPFGVLGSGQPRYWRDRPIDIGAGGPVTRRVSYNWWRLRVNLRRLLGGR